MQQEQPKNELASQISALLTHTAMAHRQYELQMLNGERDEEWARWYADFLLNHGSPELLRRHIARDQLQNRLDELLIQCDTHHRANAPEEKWEDYYARYLLELL